MMAMIDDVVVFLRARLDEVATAAQGATPGPWRLGDWEASFGTVERERTVIERAPGLDPFPTVRLRVEADLVLPLEGGWDDETIDENVAHILHHDPTRVLADVAAKRAIIDAFEEARLAKLLPGDNVFGYRAGGLLIAVRHLAAAFAGHPDYRKEWDA